MKKAIIFASLLVSFSYAHAAIGLRLVAEKNKGCKLILPVGLSEENVLAWNGQCTPDGFAHGEGRIDLNRWDKACTVEVNHGRLKGPLVCHDENGFSTVTYYNGYPILGSYSGRDGSFEYRRLKDDGRVDYTSMSDDEAYAYKRNAIAQLGPEDPEYQLPVQSRPNNPVAGNAPSAPSTPKVPGVNPSVSPAQNSDPDQSPQAIAQVIASIENKCTTSYDRLNYHLDERSVPVSVYTENGNFLSEYNADQNSAISEQDFSKYSYTQLKGFRTSFKKMYQPRISNGPNPTSMQLAKLNLTNALRAIDCFTAKFSSQKYAPKPVTPEKVAKAESSGTPLRFTAPPCVFFEQVSTDKISDMYKVIHNRCNRPMSVLFCFHDIKDVVHAKCNFDKDYSAWGLTSVIPAGRDALTADALGTQWGVSYMVCESTDPVGCKFPKKEDHVIPLEGHRIK